MTSLPGAPPPPPAGGGSGAGPRAMEMQSYYTKLLGELNEQRKRDFFCDCSIIVEGRIFKAHKNILFANSGYFRALLIHYIQDSGRHSTASLDIVTSEAFSIILDFLYSGKLDLCGENVIEVMSAASYLQMTDVVNFCKTYIRSSLDICRKIEREAAFYQADSGSASSAREGTSYGSKGQCSASISSLQEKERISDCQRDPPCGECSGCHPLELVVRDPSGSRSPDNVNSSLPKGVEPKVEFDADEVEVEVGERLPQYPTPLSLEQMEEGLHSGQAMDLACNNYHMKQFLEALLRNGSAQRKEDVVHHFVRGFEGRPEDAGVAMSSMMDIHSDWYGEDAGRALNAPQASVISFEGPKSSEVNSSIPDALFLRLGWPDISTGNVLQPHQLWCGRTHGSICKHLPQSVPERGKTNPLVEHLGLHAGKEASI
ncbi:zinc finger and BTB domain-containing protein 8B isoform X2 [Phaenicophaeus curvirostris]|uniref:zinc finger and BTB domain-containing protein 8B isoform X2 n=1 Tax=Phaenicophaeus curvirostris TaxID=33595 RepID=UPI0037F0CFBD